MVEFIYLSLEEQFDGTKGTERSPQCDLQPTPLDPTHQDFDFSLWSRAVKARMNRVLQKRGL